MGEILRGSFNDGVLFSSLMHPHRKRLVETRHSYYIPFSYPIIQTSAAMRFIDLHCVKYTESRSL